MSENENPDLIKVSWSSLLVMQECAQKSFLYRTGHRSQVANKRNFFPGMVCDRVMRDWLNDVNRQPGQMPDMVSSILDREESETVESGQGVIKWRDTQDKKRTLEWCRRLVVNLEPALNALVLPYYFEPARRFAAPLKIDLGEGDIRDVQLVGEMDILVRDNDDRFHVLDLKATENKQYYRKTLGQLIFYDLAVQVLFNSGPCKTTGLIQPMIEDSPVLLFEFSPDDYSQMWNRIRRYVVDVEGTKKDPKVSNSGCSWCDVRHACEKFNKVTEDGKVLLQGISIKDLL